MAYFFDGLPAAGMRPIAHYTLAAAAAFTSRETAELVAAYHRIADPKSRRAVARLIRVMSDAAG